MLMYRYFTKKVLRHNSTFPFFERRRYFIVLIEYARNVACSQAMKKQRAPTYNVLQYLRASLK